GLPYSVMPYVDGESIDVKLHRTGAFGVRESLGIMKDVARALAFAHERGVVHRDIKPGNILLAAGSATVTDFGVAKALSSARRSGEKGNGLTNTGLSLGTVLYMAPEQAAGDPSIDGRADIYSLGVTVYEMLAGSAPFAKLGPRRVDCRAQAGGPRHRGGAAVRQPRRRFVECLSGHRTDQRGCRQVDEDSRAARSRAGPPSLRSSSQRHRGDSEPRRAAGARG